MTQHSGDKSSSLSFLLAVLSLSLSMPLNDEDRFPDTRKRIVIPQWETMASGEVWFRGSCLQPPSHTGKHIVTLLFFVRLFGPCSDMIHFVLDEVKSLACNDT